MAAIRPLTTVARSGLGRSAGALTDPIIYLPGADWDSVPGTDRHLAEALTKRLPVIWMDPSRSIMQIRRTGVRVPAVSRPAPNLTRLSVDVLPGNSRLVLRDLARIMVVRRLRAYLHDRGLRPSAIIASTTEPVLAGVGELPGTHVYFATDDFVAAAGLWKRSAGYLSRARERNLAAADLVIAVTPELAESLRRTKADPLWFPNGVDLELYRGIDSVAPSTAIRLKGPRAGVVGQLNERLDLGFLEEVQEAGISLLLVGPVAFRDRAAERRLWRLTEHRNVQWIDRVPPDQLPPLLRGLKVGLTPYVDSMFNRRSFPLKTLDYLAAGIPVVSSRVPPLNGFDARFVAAADSAATFVGLVKAALSADLEPAAVRKSVASYGWSERAADLLAILGLESSCTGQLAPPGYAKERRRA